MCFNDSLQFLRHWIRWVEFVKGFVIKLFFLNFANSFWNFDSRLDVGSYRIIFHFTICSSIFHCKKSPDFARNYEETVRLRKISTLGNQVKLQYFPLFFWSHLSHLWLQIPIFYQIDISSFFCFVSFRQ